MPADLSTNAAAILSPLLADLPPQLILVTGESGAGKTTWCRALVDHARALGLTVGGVLSPPAFTDGVKTGIWLENLATGERRQLATLRLHMLADAPTRKWQFNEGVLRWGDRVLQRLKSPQMLLIDEIGPLEFEHGQGLVSAFDALARRDYHVGLAVVRPSLLAAAQRRWSLDRVLVVREGRAYPGAADSEAFPSSDSA